MQQPGDPGVSAHAPLEAERRAASKVTLIGMVLDAFLGILKVIGGTLFHSQALVVDGVHSFTDVVSDAVVLFIMRVSRKAPDDNHPYGHQRIETLGTMLLGSLLIAVGAALAWENILRLTSGEEQLVPGWPVLVAAAVSVGSKEWIYRYTRRVGIRIRSDLIIANAWHSRTDAFSSVVVLFSTVGAMLGYVWMDIVAAVVIAGIIIYIGWKFTWDSMKELVDTGLSEEETEELKVIAMETEGVRNVHDLRSRRMGHDVFLDLHLVVRPEISVSEGHQIGMKAIAEMRKAQENLRDVTFHIDAENDARAPYATDPDLPGREDIRRLLIRNSTELPAESRLRLHYLKNHIHIEIFLDGHHDNPRLTADQVQAALEAYPWFGSVRVWTAVR